MSSITRRTLDLHGSAIGQKIVMVLTVKIEQFLFIHVLVEMVSLTQKQLFSKLIVVVSSKINYKNKQNGQIIRVQKSVAVSLICFI